VSERWKYVADSARGESHLRLDQPCQDAHQVGVLRGIEGEVLVVACADGAGSAAFAREGASLACAALLRYVEAYLLSERQLSSLNRQTALQWVSQIRSELTAAAQESGVALREFACTLLGALVSDNCMFAFQVGDGAIVISKESVIQTVFWPDQGEYANTTTFITGDDVEPHFNCSLLAYPVRELAVLTDGLQRLALDFAQKSAHPPFFEPMFSRLRQCDDASSLQLPLSQFLNSDAVNQRTDDDKTLVVAVRKNGDTRP
jgi:hypothetical protein